ncbi:MAG: heparin lyase I family protein [Alphaproteobacteria bacterium]|nr:heparin lyase I family protein [Alphaproteobacteria bacterium]
MSIRLALAAGILLIATQPTRSEPAQPVFREDFAYAPGLLPLDKWVIPPGRDRSRLAIVSDPIGKTVLRVTVQEGDVLDGATEAMREARRYVCDGQGSRARAMESEPGGVAPTERTEVQLRTDAATGAGEVVTFGAPVWYRFSFKLAGDWPHDVPAAGRTPCRTVIQQIKQDSFKDGVSCGASPFLKIEARPSGDRARFFAQIATGAPCAAPPQVRRVQICVTNDLRRDVWNTVNVRLYPAQDASGRADIWLNGVHCGAYRGPMGDPQQGFRRDGRPVVNTQPRFGIYRDWRAETQTIYFDRIVFWDADPTGHPDWIIAGQPTP